MSGLIITVLSSFVFGFTILKVLRVTCRGLKWLTVAVCTGMSFWCLVLFLLGHLHLFNHGFLIVISVLPCLFLPVILIRIKPQLHLQMLVCELSLFEKVLVGVIFIILILTFLTSFLPVTGGIRNDEVHNHLSVPKEWFRSGGLEPLPYAVSYQAGNAHLLFLLTGIYSAESGPKLLSWFAFVLCTAAVYCLARFFLERRVSLLAAAMVAINPLIFRGAPTAFVDQISSLFVVVPVLTGILYIKNKDVSLIILCSLLLGTGCGTKPTNILYAYSIIICMSITLVKKMGVVPAVKTALIFSALTTVFSSPWMIRTFLLTGCPVFPPPLFWMEKVGIFSFLSSAQPFSSGEVQSFYNYCISRYGDYSRNFSQLLRFPWDLTMTPERFQIGDSIGTLMLSFLPFTFLAGRAIPLFIPLAAALSSMLIYTLLLPEARYYMGAFMLISPAIAKTVDTLSRKSLLKHIIAVVLYSNMVFSLLVASRTMLPKIKHITGEARSNFRRSGIPYCEAFDYLKDHTVDNVSLFYFHPVFYYLSCEYEIQENPDSLLFSYDTSYVLDIDYSQVSGRDFSVQNRSFMLQSTPGDAELAFESWDARVYRFIRKK